MDASLPLTETSINADAPACPLCSSVHTRTVCEYAGKSLLKCSGCGVSFLFPQPSLQDCTTHFEQGSSLTARELKNKFENNRARVLARVATEIRKRRPVGTILDVGCATGVFLSHFFLSAEWERWGVDLSPVAAQHATQAGIEVRCGNIRDANFAETQFDVVTVLDAFYYFKTPQEDLTEIRRVLKDDGLLAIELPLATSRIWRSSSFIGKLLSGSRRSLLDSSDHLFYFTPKSVTALLSRVGFIVNQIVPLPGNRQVSPGRDFAVRSYFRISELLRLLSRSRIFLAPRFLVLTTKSAPHR